MRQRIAPPLPRDLTVLTCREENIKGQTQSKGHKKSAAKILSHREFACNY